MLNDESSVREGLLGKKPDCHDFHSCPEIKGQSDQSDQIISLRRWAGSIHLFPLCTLFTSSLLPSLRRAPSIHNAALSFAEIVFTPRSRTARTDSTHSLTLNSSEFIAKQEKEKRLRPTEFWLVSYVSYFLPAQPDTN